MTHEQPMKDLRFEFMGDSLRVHYVLTRRPGLYVSTVERGFIDVLYTDVPSLGPIPDRRRQYPYFPENCAEIAIPECDRVIVFIFESHMTESVGDPEEELYGPYFKEEMKGRIERRLEALNEASRGNYDLLRELTGMDDHVRAAISLLKYKQSTDINPSVPGDYTQPGDYTEGAVVRAAAAELLGKIGDGRATNPLEVALNDPGDDAGANDSRSQFYYDNRKLVKDATTNTLSQLRSRG